MFEIFAPGWAAITTVANAVTATAAVALPEGAEEVALYNSSATATTFVRVTPYFGATVPTGDEPTTSRGMPVPPGQLIRIRVGRGPKVIRTIATAADGNITIIPGNGG